MERLLKGYKPYTTTKKLHLYTHVHEF